MTDDKMKMMAFSVEVDKEKMIKGLAECCEIRFSGNNRPDCISEACDSASKILDSLSRALNEIKDKKHSAVIFVKNSVLKDNLSLDSEIMNTQEFKEFLSNKLKDSGVSPDSNAVDALAKLFESIIKSEEL